MKVFRIESQLGLQTGIPGHGLLGRCFPYMVMLSGNGSVVEPLNDLHVTIYTVILGWKPNFPFCRVCAYVQSEMASALPWFQTNRPTVVRCRLGHPSHSFFAQVAKVPHRTGRGFGSESRRTMAQLAGTVSVKKKRDVEKRFAHAPWVLPRAGHHSATPDGKHPFLQHGLLVVTLHARPTGKGVYPPSAPLCVFLTITRPTQTRSRRDPALLRVLETVNAASPHRLPCQLCLPPSLVLSPQPSPVLTTLISNECGRSPPTGAKIWLPLPSPRRVLGVDQIDTLTYTVRELLGTRSLITCFLFPSLILDDNSSGARTASPSVPLCCPPRRTPSTHGMRWSALPATQNLSCVVSWVLSHVLRVSRGPSRPHSNVTFRLFSMSFLSSHTTYPTPNLQGPPLQHSLLLLDHLPFCLGPAAPPFRHARPGLFRATNELWHDLPVLITNESELFGWFGGGHGSAPPLGMSAFIKDWIHSCPAILQRTSHWLRNHIPSCHWGLHSKRLPVEVEDPHVCA